jgi:ribosomal protein S18 acetylase RimI-like enzyme
MPSNDTATIRRLVPGDAAALCRFYNGLSARSKRLFHPLGDETTEERCRAVAEENDPTRDTKLDLIAASGDGIVGWGFLWGRDGAPGEATFGLAVADDVQGRGLGRRLMASVLDGGAGRGLERITLTVVQDNAIAQRLYEGMSFVRTGEFVGQDGLPYFSMVSDLPRAGSTGSGGGPGQ